MIRENPGRMTGVFDRYSDALGWLEYSDWARRRCATITVGGVCLCVAGGRRGGVATVVEWYVVVVCGKR